MRKFKKFIPFLSILGFAAAPANATDEVRATVGYVSPHENGDGVVDILRHWQGAQKRRLFQQEQCSRYAERKA